jgi:hypothetical protein
MRMQRPVLDTGDWGGCVSKPGGQMNESVVEDRVNQKKNSRNSVLSSLSLWEALDGKRARRDSPRPPFTLATRQMDLERFDVRTPCQTGGMLLGLLPGRDDCRFRNANCDWD